MAVPGVGREHQAEIVELALSFVQGRDGMTHSAAWDQRVGWEVTEFKRARVWADERKRRGVPP